jgi:O-antigen ligase
LNENKDGLFLVKCFLALNTFLVAGSLINKFVFPIETFYGLELFGKRNSLGPLLTELPFLLLGVLFLRNELGVTIWGYALFGLNILVLVINQSRGAWVGFSCGLICFLLLGLRAGFIKLKQLNLIFVLLIVVVIAGMPYLQERLSSGFKDDAAQDRIHLSKLAFEVIKNNPILGVGLGNYTFEMKKYLLKSDLVIPWVAGVHNQYLLVWAETGLFGIIAFIIMLASTIMRGIRTSKLAPFYAPILIGLVSVLASFMVQMLFDSYRDTWMVWGSMGLVSGIWRKSRHGETNR